MATYISRFDLNDPTVKANAYSVVRYALPEQPRQVRVELARNCTAACPWCHLYGRDDAFKAKAPGTELGLMDVRLFEQLMDDIASWPKPLQELAPTNYGEMLMHKQWLPMLQLAERKLPKTGIAVVTTGIALTDENLEKLASISTLVYVNMSINAYFSETWERQHRRPAKLMQQCVAAVHKFRDRRPDVRVNVSMVYDTELVTEIERDLFLSYWSPFGSVTINERSHAGWPGRGPKVPVTLPCRSVFDGLVVFNDGNVGTGCCFDGLKEPSLNVGHVPEESLLTIWRGEKLRAIADTHNAGRRATLPLCARCTYA